MKEIKEIETEETVKKKVFLIEKMMLPQKIEELIEKYNFIKIQLPRGHQAKNVELLIFKTFYHSKVVVVVNTSYSVAVSHYYIFHDDEEFREHERIRFIADLNKLLRICVADVFKDARIEAWN